MPNSKCLFFFLSIWFLWVGSPLAVCQFVPNIDPTFGNNGVAAANFYDDWDQAESSARYGDGRVLVAGVSRNGSTGQRFMVLARFGEMGLPDVNFGIDGKVFDLPGTSGVFKVRDPIIMANGQIIVPFTRTVDNIVMACVIRLLPNGQLDNTFGENGLYQSSHAQGSELNGCLLLPNDTLFCIGLTYVNVPPDGLLRSRFSSFKLLGSGELDSSYTGMLPYLVHGLAINNGQDISYATCFTNDGSVLVAGKSSAGTGQMLLKVKTNGQFDSTFGVNGRIFQQPIYSQNNPTRIIQASNGGYLMTGMAQLNGSLQIGHTAVYKFKSDGRYDSTFGVQGVGVTPYTEVGNYLAVDLQEDASGKIWAVHSGRDYSIASYYTLSVSRFLSSGIIDSSYGGRGFVVSGLSGIPKRIFLESDGYPLVVGEGNRTNFTVSKDLVVVKIKPAIVNATEILDHRLILYPSVIPAGTETTIRLPGVGAASVKVTDVAGREVLVLKEQEDQVIKIGFKGVSQGIYTIHLWQNGHWFASKIFVN